MPGQFVRHILGYRQMTGLYIQKLGLLDLSEIEDFFPFNCFGFVLTQNTVEHLCILRHKCLQKNCLFLNLEYLILHAIFVMLFLIEILLPIIRFPAISKGILHLHRLKPYNFGSAKQVSSHFDKSLICSLTVREGNGNKKRALRQRCRFGLCVTPITSRQKVKSKLIFSSLPFLQMVW